MGLRGKKVHADWSLGTHGRAQKRHHKFLLCETGSWACSLQALPILKVGPHQGPTPFYLGTCLPPAAVHGTQAVGAKGLLQASSELPLATPHLSSYVHWSPKSRGPEVAGGWFISTAPNVCTYGQAATASRIDPGFLFVPSCHWLNGACSSGHASLL